MVATAADGPVVVEVRYYIRNRQMFVRVIYRARLRISKAWGLICAGVKGYDQQRAVGIALDTPEYCVAHYGNGTEHVVGTVSSLEAAVALGRTDAVLASEEARVDALRGHFVMVLHALPKSLLGTRGVE